ncbi:MAG: hypothetical protein ACK5KT_10570 [Dysgonomonas sp.]
MTTKSPATLFAEEVIQAFTKDLTDNVFLYIQENEELLQMYLDAISESDRKTVNSVLGKLIKKRFDVKNEIDDKTGRFEKGEPKSVLIKTTYTKHSKR